MLFLYDPAAELDNKIRKWLDDNGVTYEARSLTEDRPTAQEILDWADIGRLPLRSFWNAEKPSFKMIRLMNNMLFMPRETRAYVLTSDVSFLRHPMLIGENFVVLGTNKAEWQKALKIQS